MEKNRTLTLGHSPDADDAFMFFALAENKIDTRGWRFEHILQDIETLNDRAMRGELHISAISFHAYAHVLDQYALLPCGSSMGDDYGPMLVAKNRADLAADAGDDSIRDFLHSKKIAVPGLRTSAYLALRIFLGECDCVVVPFDKIFNAVKSGRADVGLIIHEGQLSYAGEGFSKILDLGQWWKRETNLPLPLGGNVIRKDIEPAQQREISDILRASIQFSLDHRADAVAHAMRYARGLTPPIADKFIGMYVNERTLDYGDTGRRAVREFLRRGHEAGVIPRPVELEFV